MRLSLGDGESRRVSGAREREVSAAERMGNIFGRNRTMGFIWVGSIDCAGSGIFEGDIGSS